MGSTGRRHEVGAWLVPVAVLRVHLVSRDPIATACAFHGKRTRSSERAPSSGDQTSCLLSSPLTGSRCSLHHAQQQRTFSLDGAQAASCVPAQQRRRSPPPWPVVPSGHG